MTDTSRRRERLWESASVAAQWIKTSHIMPFLAVGICEDGERVVVSPPPSILNRAKHDAESLWRLVMLARYLFSKNRVTSYTLATSIPLNKESRGHKRMTVVSVDRDGCIGMQQSYETDSDGRAINLGPPMPLKEADIPPQMLCLMRPIKNMTPALRKMLESLEGEYDPDEGNDYDPSSHLH